MDRNDWAHYFIDKLGAVHGVNNARAIVSWIQAEGGTAHWNPLNTTQKEPGSWDYNSVGVQNYPDFDTGLAATVKTILQTDKDLGYYRIVGRLRRAERPARTLRAVEASQWGTGGLALEVLPYVKADYWKYAHIKIAS